MFIGEYKHNLDAKGRLAIPVKFRQLLKDGAVVTRGLDNCLFLYPKNEWGTIAKKLADMPVGLTKARAIARHMLAGAMEADFDSQGRITLPEYLRLYASIDKKAVVAGLYDRLEIWDESKWENYRSETEHASAEIAESLGELGV